jgi:hypothetical protein
VLDAVAKGRREHALPATSAAFESGRAALVAAETAQRPTVLGLIASGRMRPDAGRVEISTRSQSSRSRRRSDGRTDASALRRHVALVDAPDVSEPEPNVTLAGVAAEELMFAGRRSDPLAVRRWLDEHALGHAASVPVSNVDPADRVRALCELAVLRAGVEGIVLVSPDRHGGEPAAWWAIAEDFAARGFAVLVIAGQAAQQVTAVPEPGPVPEPDPVPEPGPVPEPVEGRRTSVAPGAPGIRLRRFTARSKGVRA